MTTWEVNPTTKTMASSFLGRARLHLFETELDYHVMRAQKLLDALSDLLMAEACIESWMADLGTNGCSV